MKTNGRALVRTEPGPNPVKVLQACICKLVNTCLIKSLVVTCEVKFNPLIVVGQSTLYLKLKTSVSGLNLTIPVTASDFQSVNKSF